MANEAGFYSTHPVERSQAHREAVKAIAELNTVLNSLGQASPDLLDPQRACQPGERKPNPYYQANIFRGRLFQMLDLADDGEG